ADYRAVPRVVFCDPQVASVGASSGAATGTAQLAGVARTSTYTREYADKPGFLTLVSDGSKLIAASAVEPHAGAAPQQQTLAMPCWAALSPRSRSSAYMKTPSSNGPRRRSVSVRPAIAQPTAQSTLRGSFASHGPARPGTTARATSAVSVCTLSWRVPSGSSTSGASRRSSCFAASSASCASESSRSSTSGLTTTVTGSSTVRTPMLIPRP